MPGQEAEQDSCDHCGAVAVRLLSTPRHIVKNDGIIVDTEPEILCDECYEEETGLPACCEDFCGLHLDHNGLCKVR
jgi:hypothetical protein